MFEDSIGCQSYSISARALVGCHNRNMEEYVSIPGRWSTAAAIKRVNSLLNIGEDQYSQDWEFEISDSTRLAEYLDIYENELTNKDERFALMSVIIDAFESYGLDEDLWSKIRVHLKAESALHQYTIVYWCCLDEEILDNCWRVTPWMRQLWEECKMA